MIIATVNGDPVRKAEVDRMLRNPLLRGESGAPETDPPDSAALEALVLRTLIHRRLLAQEAAARQIVVTDQELDQAINALRRRFEDLKSFGAWMQEQGLNDPELFESVRLDMLANRVRASLVAGVRVSEPDARTFYEEHQQELTVDEVRLQIIVVRDRSSAEEILKAAIEGREDFGRLARERSAGKRAGQGGDSGWVSVTSLWPPLRAMIESLEPRQATGPLQRGDEFLVVRLHDRRSRKASTYDEARADIELRLGPIVRQRIVQAWLEEREKRSAIEMVRPVK